MADPHRTANPTAGASPTEAARTATAPTATAPAAGAGQPADAALVEGELLVEEVSIDGMCGVY